MAQKTSVNFFSFEFPEIPGVACAFQFKSSPPAFAEDSMAGNISLLAGDNLDNARETRRQLLAALANEGLVDFYECRQVHGATVLANPKANAAIVDPSELPEADGMATNENGLGLMIKTADCQPLLVAHKSGKYILALHVGWRGNRLNFPGSGIRKFCDLYNLSPGDLSAARGPSLGPAHARFTAFTEEWGESFRPWYDEKSQRMNLWELTKAQLVEAGLSRQNIYSLDICTFANAKYFFSYRKNRSAGRQASLIWIRKPE